MRPSRAHPLRVGLALVAALAAVGCGGSDEQGAPLAAGDAAFLAGQLAQVDRVVARGQCELVRERPLTQLADRVQALPPTVDATIRQTLVDGIAHLEELVATNCKQRPKRKRKRKPEPAPSPEPEQAPEQEQPQVEPEPEPEPEPEEEEKKEAPEKEKEKPKNQEPPKTKDDEPQDTDTGGTTAPQGGSGGSGSGQGQRGTGTVSAPGSGRSSSA
ncbi:MAG: hypothetical protein M3133_04060 [Actinomycetota bacterium]|nr:hypothetical protein [Actinomycetota bacterium]